MRAERERGWGGGRKGVCVWSIYCIHMAYCDTLIAYFLRCFGIMEFGVKLVVNLEAIMFKNCHSYRQNYYYIIIIIIIIIIRFFGSYIVMLQFVSQHFACLFLDHIGDQ